MHQTVTHSHAFPFAKQGRKSNAFLHFLTPFASNCKTNSLISPRKIIGFTQQTNWNYTTNYFIWINNSYEMPL